MTIFKKIFNVNSCQTRFADKQIFSYKGFLRILEKRLFLLGGTALWTVIEK